MLLSTFPAPAALLLQSTVAFCGVVPLLSPLVYSPFSYPSFICNGLPVVLLIPSLFLSSFFLFFTTWSIVTGVVNILSTFAPSAPIARIRTHSFLYERVYTALPLVLDFTLSVEPVLSFVPRPWLALQTRPYLSYDELLVIISCIVCRAPPRGPFFAEVCQGFALVCGPDAGVVPSRCETWAETHFTLYG